MAKRGRPRKPAEEHYANGTYREHKHGPLPTVPDPVEAPPDKPAGLYDDVSAKWDAVVPALAHILRPRDGGLVLELCRWLVRADQVEEVLATRAPGTKGFTTLLGAAATATNALLALSAKFGLTPADRAKIKIVVAPTGAGAKPKVATRPRTALDGQAPPAN